MGVQCCLGGSTFHALKHAATIPSLYSSNLIRPLSQTLTLTFNLFSPNHRPPFPILPRALSTPTPDKDLAAKAQWKAAIDFKWIRDNKDSVALNITNRNSIANLEAVLHLYDKLLALQKEVERLRAERNVVANKMKGKVELAERQKLIEDGKNLKEGLVTLEENLLKLTEELQQEAQCIPNMTHPDVPIGGEDCSTLRKMAGSPREFSFPIKDHLQLGKELDLFDFDAAAEVLFLIEGIQASLACPYGGAPSQIAIHPPVAHLNIMLLIKLLFRLLSVQPFVLLFIIWYLVFIQFLI